MTTIDAAVHRMHRGALAATSGQRHGRMLAVTAQRLPGPGSPFVDIAVPLLVTIVIMAVRRLARRVSR